MRKAVSGVLFYSGSSISCSMGTKPNFSYSGLPIALTIASDATVMVLSRKLNIPIKYRENYFRFGKNKKDKK